MSPKKNCFFDAKRPCDLTCKAAFEVDDPVDNVDCYFIWLTYHLGESFFELKKVLDGLGGFGGGGAGPGGSGPLGFPGVGGSPPPKPPGKGEPNN